MAPVLVKVLNALLSRHADLHRWLTNSTETEISTRLGKHSRDVVQHEITQLESAIERCKNNDLGRCKVCNDTVETHLLEMDYAAAVCLSHFNEEERDRLENELELSIKVQRALLPRSAPSIEGWKMAAFSQPASIVGGDYFDFLKFGDGAEAVIIADVMGKGMPASMLMANMQASLRIIVPESRSPEEVVMRLNRLFHHNITLTKFVSLFIGHLDATTGRLLYVNAGHNPPFVIRGNGEPAQFIPLPPTGPAIGLVEEPEFKVGSITVGDGEIVALYTDGIVESRSSSGEEFGEERLKEILRSSSEKPVAQITQNVRSRLREYMGRSTPDDDATLIVCRRNPA